MYSGLLLSFPRSADQPWHQDGTALFGGHELPTVEGGAVVDLPPYALNVFVPLEEVTEEVGPTEFWVGSHLGDRARGILEGISGEGDGVDERVFGPCLRMGDALLYDYRICHRGTRNLSGISGDDKTRPMLYLIYARPWFQEHLNFGSDRLFPPPDSNKLEL